MIDQSKKRDLKPGDKKLKRKMMHLNRTAIDYPEAHINSYNIDCQWFRTAGHNTGPVVMFPAA